MYQDSFKIAPKPKTDGALVNCLQTSPSASSYSVGGAKPA